MEHSSQRLAAFYDQPPPHQPHSALTRLMRRTLLAATLGALIILVTMVSAHLTPRVEIARPDARLMPGTPYSPNQVCFSLHNGDFQCSVDDDISILYNGANGRIQTTTQQTHGTTLGDLLVLWGAPDGYSIHANIIVLTWERQHTAAYLNHCTLRVNAPVWQVEYGANQARRLPWRGFIGAVTSCR